MAQSGLGWTHLYLANYDTAASHFRQALLHRSVADHRGTAGNLFGLGWTSLLLESSRRLWRPSRGHCASENWQRIGVARP